MYEIRPEAHIRCHAVSDESIWPGVKSMIRELRPGEVKYQTGKAEITYGYTTSDFTFAVGFEPQKVFMQGYKYVNTYTSPYYYYRYYTLALMCDFQTKKFESTVMRYQRYNKSGGTTYHTNNPKEGAGDFEYTINDDGTVTVMIPTSILSSYVSDEMQPTFYAIGYPRGVVQDVTPYEGAYEVTPMAGEQTVLPTAQKLMERDVTVEQIPYYETSNDAGGETVYIGTEVNGYGG